MSTSNELAVGHPIAEPYTWPEVAEISRNILAVRYSLLPYYYTLFYEVLHTPVANISPHRALICACRVVLCLTGS
jgi:hypothetical protein